MSEERYGAVTTKGNPLTVLGEVRQVGDKAPDFTLSANDWSKVSSSEFEGMVRLFSVVPSLATGICDAQTRRFNQEAADFGDDVVILTISGEPPPNQRQWCGAAGIDRVQVLSDLLEMNFGDAYGTHIKEWRLEQRSIFVVDRTGIITYVEYVPKIGQHPDYEAALTAVRAALDA